MQEEEDDEGYSGPPSPTGSVNSGSELATGAGTIQEEDQDVDNMADQLSDTGWETDLEIEGTHTCTSVCLKRADEAPDTQI